MHSELFDRLYRENEKPTKERNREGEREKRERDSFALCAWGGLVDFDMDVGQSLLESVTSCLSDMRAAANINKGEFAAALSQLVQRDVGDLITIAKTNPVQLWALLGQMLHALISDLDAMS